MSVSTLLQRIERAMRMRDRRIDQRPAFQEGLTIILNDFDTAFLVKADDVSGGEVIRVLSDIAIVVCDHRKEKIRTTKITTVTTSDFIPAFGYISSLGRSRFEYRTVLDAYRKRYGSRRGIFSEEIVTLIRKSCPWCDE